MSYRVDEEKAYDILYCLTPPRILVNRPLYVNGRNFVNKFKKEGFSVLSLDKLDPAKIKKTWNLSSHNPVIIEGCFENTEDIVSNFTGIYSYIYLYPNTTQNYAHQILDHITSDTSNTDEIVNIRNLKLKGDPSWKKEFELLVGNCAKKNQTLYKEHCKLFDNKILTVLI